MRQLLHGDLGPGLHACTVPAHVLADVNANSSGRAVTQDGHALQVLVERCTAFLLAEHPALLGMQTQVVLEQLHVPRRDVASEARYSDADLQALERLTPVK